MTVFVLKLLLLVFLVTPGCQSLPPFDSSVVPVKVLKQFQECSPSDGGVEVRTFQDGVRSGSVELDWKSFAPNELRAEAIDPLGRQLLGLRFAGPMVEVTGQHLDSLPKMAVDEDGFLIINDFRIGIRQDELACLLNFKIPLAWRSKISGYQSISGQSQVWIAENRRNIQMTIYDDFVYKSDRICTIFEWHSFFGFRTDHLTWCKEIRGGRRMSEIHDDKRTLIEWAENAESENP